jgi:translocation and assembly module TamB
MRRLFGIAMVVLVIVTGWWTSGMSPAQEQTAKSLVESMLENLLATEGRSVSIEGLAISLNGDVSVTRVEIKDGEAPWLVLDGLALDWQPLSLLGNTLEIGKLSVDSVDLRRLPQSEEAGVAAPAEMSGLRNANIASLVIGTFRLDPQVAGEETVLKIDGKAQVVQEPAEIRLSFLAERSDGKTGSLKVEASLDPKSRELDVGLLLKEESKGLVARLLRLRGDPAVALALEAKGNLGAWSGELALDLDGVRTLAGTAAYTGKDGRQALALEASGDVSRLAPESLDRLLRGESQLIGSIGFPAGGGRIDFDRLVIDNEAYQLRLAGPLDWAGSGSDVSLTLSPKSRDEAIPLPELVGLGEARLDGLAGTITLKGAALNPAWTLTADAERLANGMLVIARPGLSLSGSGVPGQGEVVQLDGLIKGDLAQGTAGQLPKAVTGPLTGGFSAYWQGDGQVMLPHLSLAAGAITLSADGRAEPARGAFDLSISATASDPVTGIAVADRLLAGRVTASGRVSRDGSGRYWLSALKLGGAGVAATLDGSVTAEDGDLSLALELPEVGRLDTRAAGEATGRATLKGPWSGPAFTVAVEGHDNRLLGRVLAEARLMAQGRLSADMPQAEISLQAKLDGKPVNVAATVETDASGTRMLRNLVATANTATLAGELRWPETGLPSGRFTLSASELADIGPLLLTEMTGRLEASVEIEDIAPGGRISVEFSGKDLAIETLQARRAEGRMVIGDPFGQPRPEGEVVMTGARFGALAFDMADITARASGPDRYELAVKAQGRDVTADAAAALSIAGTEMRLAVSRLEGRLRGIPVRASAPFTVRRTGDAVAVDALALAVGDGRVSVDGRLLPELAAAIRLERLSLEAIAPLVQTPGLAGRLSGMLRVSGSPSAPSGSFEVNGDGVTLALLREQGIAPLTFAASGSVRDRVVSLNASGQSGAATRVSVEGSVQLGDPLRLDLRLQGRTDAAFLTERLADGGIRFEADTQFDLRVSGPATAPAINGSADLSSATFGDAAGRFLVRQARGRLTIADNVLRLSDVRGATGKNGTAVFNGSVDLRGSLAADIRARIANGTYTDGSFVTTRYDADLSLTGPLLTGPLLAGEIGLRRTKITLSSLPPQALAAPDVRHRKAPAPVRRQAALLAEARGGAGGTVRLDILLRARDPIAVSGRGLNVTLGGSLRLGGTFDQLTAQGAFRLQRGSLKLLARRLDFESGRLDFDIGLDPRIHFVAVSRRTDATITLTLSGRASAPDIAVTANPDMPEEEAMARLIFDRSMLQLSPLQIAQIASYVATLSGGRDTGLLTGLQNALGTDWLEVIETESGETAVSVGKRINERLSVGVEQTTRTNTSRVIIDLGLGKNLKARGSYGTDGASRAGIYYEKDY